MVIAAIQPLTSSPLTFRLLELRSTASTLPWKVYDFFSEAVCAKHIPTMTLHVAMSVINREMLFIVHLKNEPMSVEILAQAFPGLPPEGQTEPLISFMKLELGGHASV